MILASSSRVLSVSHYSLTVDFNCFYELCICCRTAKGNPPVTFAVAACETQNVSVTVLPCFGLSEGSSPTAKEMWDKMVQVLFSVLWCSNAMYNVCFWLLNVMCLILLWNLTEIQLLVLTSTCQFSDLVD